MATINLPVKSDTVPAGFCPPFFTTFQWQQILNLMYVPLDIGDGYLVKSETPPPIELQVYPWQRLIGGKPEHIYTYSVDCWISLHPVPVPTVDGEGFVTMFIGAEADIEFYDGNTDPPLTAVTDRTGPFWKKVAALDGRSPMGPGTIAGGTTVLASAGTYGTETHALTVAELPAHSHGLGNHQVLDTNSTSLTMTTPTAGPPNLVGYTTAAVNGSGDALNITHPVYGIWFVSRTQRKYYRIDA